MSGIRNKISRIRTGGQSGVDRAAMDFAREWGITLCGWCPRDGWAEDYPDPPGLLLDYPELTETPSGDTVQRTKWNMRDCDAILTIIPEGSACSPGTDTGLEEGMILGKPMYTAYSPENVPDIIRWIKSLPDGTELCVGGPRASECPYAYDVARTILDYIAETMNDLKYVTLRDRPELMDAAAEWFHRKWNVPEEAYLECMTAYLNRETEYGWYLCLDDDQIVGGMGVIENDFHYRKDLAPNVCAVYTEKDYRGRRIAGNLLEMVVDDMRSKGISPLYLVTDHIGFYERYGWEFLCMVQGDGEPDPSRMYIHR